MFRKKNVQPDPLLEKRDALSAEVGRWWSEIDAQLDTILAQYQMTFLFPFGCPDDKATREDLEKEQMHLRSMVGEYDCALMHYRKFMKEHPEIHYAQWQDSHTAIRSMLRRKK